MNDATSRVFAIVFLLLLMLSNLQVSIVVCEKTSYKYMFVFFVPRVNVHRLVDVASSYGLHSAVIRLETDLKVQLDYYVYWLLSGIRPEDPNISLVTADIDQERLIYLWGNATLIDLPVVDPGKHPYAINPVINIRRSHIPPAILEIPINGSVYWRDLETPVISSLIDKRLEIRLERLNLSLITENIAEKRLLGPQLVMLLEPKALGECYVLLYVMSMNESHIRLFFPGSFSRTGYASENIGQAFGVISHWYLMLKYSNITKELTTEAFEWWFNDTVSTSREYLLRAIVSANTSIHYVYLPHLEIVKNMLDETNVVSRYEYRLLDLLISTMVTFAETRKPDYVAIFLTVNDGEAYAVFTSKRPFEEQYVSVSLTTSQFVGMLLSYSDMFPLKHSRIFDLSHQIELLEKEVYSLRNSVSELNRTLSNTMDELVACTSQKELLEARLLEANLTYKSAEDLMNAAYAYITGGLIACIGLSILMGLLALKVSIKGKIGWKRAP